MGKIFSVAIKKPLKNFNVESRAHKIISRDKPVPAPRFESDKIEIDRLIQGNPEEFAKTLLKNEKLGKHLKDVFVVSNDVIIKNEVRQEVNPNRPLPLNRSIIDEPLFGVLEPDNVPAGKVTLTNALKFITNHQTDCVAFSSKTIAKEYTIPEETVKFILKHFKVFEMYLPENKKVKVNFAGPSIPRVKVLTEIRKQIEPGKSNKEIT